MTNNLDNQVKENRKKFRVDHFDMVISDYVQRIDKGVLILDPPYQRLFRWSNEMQSQLIESILIGIPLPPIFVFQNGDTKWEVIDGVQRTTTLKNYLQINKDSENEDDENEDEKKEEKRFEGCNILTELNGKTFREIPENLQRIVENTRIRIELVEETDDIFSQYLLFNRLNSNGEKLEAQEIRNFLIYKLNKNFYNKLLEVSNEEIFLETLGLKKDRVDRQENVEFALRFLLGREFAKIQKIPSYKKIEDLITIETDFYLKKYADLYLNDEFEILEMTIKKIHEVFGKNSFRFLQKNLNSISNSFSFAIGLSFIIENKREENLNIRQMVEEYLCSDEYKRITSRGYSPTKRIFELSKYSCDFFENK